MCLFVLLVCVCSAGFVCILHNIVNHLYQTHGVLFFGVAFFVVLQIHETLCSSFPFRLMKSTMMNRWVPTSTLSLSAWLWSGTDRWAAPHSSLIQTSTVIEGFLIYNELELHAHLHKKICMKLKTQLQTLYHLYLGCRGLYLDNLT